MLNGICTKIEANSRELVFEGRGVGLDTCSPVLEGPAEQLNKGLKT